MVTRDTWYEVVSTSQIIPVLERMEELLFLGSEITRSADYGLEYF